MENGGVGPCANGFEDRVSMPDVACHLPHTSILRRMMEKGIHKNDLINRFDHARRPCERTSLKKLVAKFGAQEAAAASDEDFHMEKEDVRVAEFAQLPIPFPPLAAFSCDLQLVTSDNSV